MVRRSRGCLVGQDDGLLRGFQNGRLLFIGEGLRSPDAEARCLIAIEVEAIDRMRMAGQWLTVGVFAGDLGGAFLSSPVLPAVAAKMKDLSTRPRKCVSGTVERS